MSDTLAERARSDAEHLLMRERIRIGSDEAVKLRRSAEYRAACTLKELADHIEALEAENARLRDALEAFTTGSMHPVDAMKKACAELKGDDDWIPAPPGKNGPDPYY